jgi:hypothetical protein
VPRVAGQGLISTDRAAVEFDSDESARLPVDRGNLNSGSASRQAPTGVVTYPPSEGYPSLAPGLTRPGLGAWAPTSQYPRARRRRVAARRLGPGLTPRVTTVAADVGQGYISEPGGLIC